MKILIVDDNVDLADGLGVILELEGHTADIAYSGEETIERIKSNHYDLVLLDAKLPDKQGIQLYFEIKVVLPAVRIIVMSGFRMEQLINHSCGGDITVIYELESDMKQLERLETYRNHIVLISGSNENTSVMIKDFLAKTNKSSVIITNVEKLDTSILLDNNYLILDINMNTLDNLAVCNQLKNEGYKGVLYLIIKSTISDDSEETEYITETGCLLKPFKPETLINYVDKIIV